jgi:hypothetical protein
MRCDLSVWREVVRLFNARSVIPNARRAVNVVFMYLCFVKLTASGSKLPIEQ